MFLDFFLLLRQHAIPVTLAEYLTLLAALRSEAGGATIDEFYALSKTILIKHEQQLDLFDRLFDQYVRGRETDLPASLPTTPPDWFTRLFDELTDAADQDSLEKAGGISGLWDEVRREQEKNNALNLNNGGNDETETGKGTSTQETDPSGEHHQGAIKVWQQRDYQNLDDSLELNTRNLKMALRRLRLLTRDGADTELDLNATISQTSRNAGLLDIRMQPSRRNRVKVLMLLDVGGSMDEHIDLCSHLFSAARYQFQHLEFFYFHNCVYETLWRDNTRRRERISTYEVLHKYNRDYKVVFVGDASMSTYELTSPKGSVEHYNEEAGLVWLERFRQQYPGLVWLNPVAAGYWHYTRSIQLIREWAGNRMFPLTINGLEQAMKSLKNPKVLFDE